MTKKILLLTASYGTGHITATKSISKSLKQLEPQCETKIVDFLHLKGEQNKLTVFQKLYNFSMEKPRLWDMFFSFTNNRISTNVLKYFLMKQYYKLAKQIIVDFDPEIVVSSHPYWNFIMEKYKQEIKNVPYICVVTDSYMIHDSWKYGDVDCYCVIDTDSKEVLEKSGIKNVKVTGFPVDPEIETPINKEKVLLELNLNPNVMTILIAIGLGALARFVKIIDYLKTKKGDYQLILTTGRYEHINRMLKEKHYVVPTSIIGWTDRMADYIRVADLVICKGGGAIVSESLSAKKPVFVPVFVPGQERGNVYIIQKYKYGFYETKTEKIFDILDKIISKEINLKEYQDNIVQNLNTHAALNIAKIVIEMLKNK
jgi:processive 1,2-diacylglycerol beta-glucosyltransferase